MNLADKNCYQCKSGLLPGHNYAAMAKTAHRIFNAIGAKSKRRPYIRSAYFGGEKIFLDNFWPHLLEKNLRDRCRRLQYLQAALELIRCSRHKPILEVKSKLKNDVYYRLLGLATDKTFIVQIKKDLKRNQKFFMSVFGYSEK